jgi:hypothetical protein
MVMTKQESGVKRARRATGTVDGKLVTTEYTITAEPPLVPEKVELGWTERVSSGSVSTWKSHPAKGKADEHANHTLAVHALIEAYRATGAAVAAVEPPAEKPAKAPRASKPAKAKGSRAKAQPVKDKPEEPAAETKPEPKAKSRRRAAKPVTVATDPTPGGQTEATASGETAPSAATADEPPRLPEPELIPVGPEHAAALDDVSSPEIQDAGQELEDAVLDDPETAAAVAGPDGWGDGYPEGKHRAPAAANPFEPDPDSPFSNTGFVR